MKIRILVIDDDEDLLFIARHSLKRQDDEFELVSTTHPQDAIQQLDEEEFDAVICDFHLGTDQMNGLEILRWLRESGNLIPFIIFTGRSREDVAIQALNLGADYYLEKGENLEGLFAEIAHHLKSVVKNRRVEEALGESEEKYLRLMENLQEGVVLVQDEIIHFANKRFADFVNMELNEILGSSFRNFIAPEYMSRVIDKYMRRQAGEEVPQEHDIVLLRKDRSRVYVRLHSGLVKYRGRIATISTVKDVSMRKAATAAFAETESRYKALFEQAADSIIVVSPETGDIIDFNERAYIDLGYSREEFSNLTLYDIEAVDDPESVMRNIAKAINEEDYLFETIHKTKLGELKDVRVSLRPVSLHGSQVVQGIVRDITERKIMENYQLESEKLFRTLTHSNPAGILVRVGEKITYANEKASEILGYTLDELIGLDAITLAHPSERHIFQKNLDEEKINGSMSEEHLHFESKAVTKGGKPIWVDYWTSSIEFRGTPARLLVLLDITEAKRNRDLLKMQKEELSELGHMMSHDLGNKMNNIQALVEIYKNSHEEEVLERIISIALQTGELLRLSAELAESGSVIHDKEEVDLNSILDQIAKILIPDGIAFQRDSFPIIQGNKQRIEQIFQNLILNAIDHGKPKKIEIRFEDTPTSKSIIISNDGNPIPNEIRSKIFARGFSTKQEGRGLGLSIVRKLVEAHSWKISLHDSPNTEFRIDMN